MISPEHDHWRLLGRPGFPAGLGPLWARRDGDAWDYGLALTEAHANPSGAVHGGVLLALIDHALSLAAWEAAGRIPCVTVQLGTQFLQAVRPGVFMQARGRPRRLTRSLVFMRGELLADGKDIVATAEGVWKIIDPAARRSSDV